MNPTTAAAATAHRWVTSLGVQQPLDRLVGGEHAGERDHGDHEQPGQVFGAAVAVGVALGRRATAERERDQQRDRGQRVGDVVQGVAQQRDRPGQHHHDRLDGGGDRRGRPG